MTAYRESARPVEDPVRSIRIASTLAERYRTVASASQIDNHALELAIGEAQQIYPEIWRHLDDARGVLASRDRDVRAFDAIRSRALRTLGVTDVAIDTTIDPFSLVLGSVHIVDVKTASFNVAGYQHAIAACHALMTQMPEVDWAAVARAEDSEIRAAGSLRTGRWLGILKWGGALVGVAAIAIAVHRCATSRPPGHDEAPSGQALEDGELSDKARLYRASLERIATLKRAYQATCDREARAQLAAALRAENREAEARSLEQATRCVPVRPRCAEIAELIARRQAEKFELADARPTCHGAVIAASGAVRTGLVIAVAGTVDKERVVIRGIASADGEQTLVPFASSPENAELAAVVDLDGDDVDELVMTSGRGFVVSRIERGAFRDIVGPSAPCQGSLSVQRDFRDGRKGEQRRPVLTIPEGPLPKGCPKPGLHYFKLVGDQLVAD